MTKTNRLETLIQRQEARKTLAAAQAAPLFLELYKKLVADGLSEACRCERSYMVSSVPHCPNCGSTNVYSYTKAGGLRVLPNGSECRARGFRCRRCTLPFTDVDTFLHCEALAPQKTVVEQRKEDHAKETMAKAGFANTEEFLQKLQEFREKGVKK